jgi:hypothetical protein
MKVGIGGGMEESRQGVQGDGFMTSYNSLYPRHELFD